ncbi:putative mitogen activated protein kinase [Leishmania major strain Friedlin]|uniref:Putative mitogen activated protein kinase n=1 Tax=Leishmania major TaxID=5664 RepID=Q4QDK3_LEIMA|nr:putative mitogen activated protein kinase [Leishmania major strain Friedlin]CAG9572704.1 mitogen-activated_protein_kinase_9_-_putative [Leishmania major strain Friedlin]CAJ07103.1 putative mitogen activated protein kinase [Leishmania major strain Friedlin]|eukprot:XP_001682595.1 putative mitogen activated protein kinase [Leishmania major strain Friedlin]
MERYTVMGQLGDGSFGTVSKAQNTSTGEIVAVKKMKQRFHSWEECLQLREIQSLRKVQHPNLVKLKEVVREKTELFMIFEYCEKNIFQIQRQRADEMSGTVAFSDKEIRSIMCQTLLGVQAIHKAGFMHRDLKPENLLISGDLVKVADFGLAKEIRSRPPFTEYVSTRWYRAPELVLHSTHYNSPVDIWACAVIFAELYLCRPLFPGTSESDQLFKICSVLGSPAPNEWDEGYQLARRMNMRFPTVAPTPLRHILTTAPPAAVDLMAQMLRFNPAERPTATQCLQHPYFTGSGGSSALYAGIATGQPHNPFQMAASSAVAAQSMSNVGLTSNSSPPPTTSNASLFKYANLFNQGNRSPLSVSSTSAPFSGSSALQGSVTSSNIVRSVTTQRKTSVPNAADSDDEFNF